MTGPLAGRRFVVTRRADQAAGLVAALEALGARAAVVPTLAIAPPEDASALDAALGGLGRVDWIAFTSVNAVEAVATRASMLGLLDRVVAGPALASVGPTTTEAIAARLPGARVAVQPATAFRAEGLAAALIDAGVAGRRVLLPVSDRARDELAVRLVEVGARVETVVAYRTVPAHDAGPALRAALEGADAVLFASPSAISGFVASLGAAGARSTPAAVLGPTTEAAARAAGMRVVAVAEPSTAEGLVTALRERFAGA